jgi:hypothetical protein
VALVASVGVAATGFLAATTAVAHATTSATLQAGPFPVGNLLSYANSDFEGSANFIAVTNVQTISDSSAHQYSHQDSLAFTADQAGTVAVKMEEDHTNGTKFAVTGGDTYTVGAYIRLPTTGTTNETVTFSLASYDSSGTWITWTDSSAVNLSSTKDWRYVEANITVPPNAAWEVDSPKITIDNATAGQETDVDLLTVKPYRAAQAIGQHGSNCDKCTYTPQEWYNSWLALGSVGQTDKEFNNSLPSTFSDTNCAGDESQVGLTSHSKWPLCIITYLNPVTSQSEMDTFLSSVNSTSPQQEIILVWHQEPEGDIFKDEPGCGTDTGSKAFKCETDIQGGYVHNSKWDKPNIFIAQDSAGFQYETGNTGADCSWMADPSGSGSGVDLYLVDYYNNGTVTGQNINKTPHNNEWQNWLTCASAQNRPLGFGEYGLDDSYEPNQNQPASLCDNGPRPPAETNAQFLPSELLNDQSYLEALPMSGQLLFPAPVWTWDYWYSYYGGTSVCTLFGNTYNAQTDWENNITQNGGGA